MSTQSFCRFSELNMRISGMEMSKILLCFSVARPVAEKCSGFGRDPRRIDISAFGVRR